jgi:hypothetical protein
MWSLREFAKPEVLNSINKEAGRNLSSQLSITAYTLLRVQALPAGFPTSVW